MLRKYTTYQTDSKYKMGLCCLCRQLDGMEHSAHTSVTMDTIVVVNEFLQEGLVLLQHLITHVWNVVKERLILYLRQKTKQNER